MNQEQSMQESWKRVAGEAAAMLVEEGMVIGLGTGSTAAQLIYALARRLDEGLRIVGAVPTSRATAELAASLHIPLTTLDRYPELDLVIDGADEIDDQLNLVKGGGGALLREKIVATAGRRFVVIGDASKRVKRLGLKMPLPVEVIPFALTPVQKRLEALCTAARVRQRDGQAYLTDNGNAIVDCSFANGIEQPEIVADQIRRVVGVVESGLFLHMASQAIIGGPDGVVVLA